MEGEGTEKEKRKGKGRGKVETLPPAIPAYAPEETSSKCYRRRDLLSTIDDQSNRQVPCTDPCLARSSTWSTVIPNKKKLSAPISSRISTLAPSSVPIVSAPFNYAHAQRAIQVP